MSAWWKKLVGLLRGDESDPFADSLPVKTHYDGASAHTGSTTDMNKPMMGTNSDRREMDERILRILDRLESQVNAQDTRLREIAAAVGRLSTSVDTLPARIPSGGNGSVGEVEVISGGENGQRLREVMSSLPDLAKSQVEALSSLDQQMNTLGEKVTAYYMSFTETSNDILDTKKGIEGVRELQADIQAKHQQAAKALNVLREMLNKTAEENRGLAAKHQSAVSGVEGSITDLRSTLTRSIQTVQDKASNASVFAILATVCAIAAAVGAFLKK